MMNTIMRNLLALLILGGVSGLAMADSPVDLQTPDAHSVMVKGKLTTFRVQISGLNFGADMEKLDSDVLVSLDSQPDMVFGIRADGDAKDVSESMVETLREAYIANIPVTIFYQIAPGKKHVKINVVQLSR